VSTQDWDATVIDALEIRRSLLPPILPHSPVEHLGFVPVQPGEVGSGHAGGDGVAEAGLHGHREAAVEVELGFGAGVGPQDGGTYGLGVGGAEHDAVRLAGQSDPGDLAEVVSSRATALTIASHQACGSVSAQPGWGRRTG